MIVFSANSKHLFDLIFYTWNRPGRSASDTEALIETFTTLMVVGRNDEGHSKDPFWEMANEKLMRNTIKLLALAGAPMSIFHNEPGDNDAADATGRGGVARLARKSYCAEMLGLVNERKIERDKAMGRTDEDPPTPEDLDQLQVENSLLEKWPRLAKETSSSIEMQWPTSSCSIRTERSSVPGNAPSSLSKRTFRERSSSWTSLRLNTARRPGGSSTACSS